MLWSVYVTEGLQYFDTVVQRQSLTGWQASAWYQCIDVPELVPPSRVFWVLVALCLGAIASIPQDLNVELIKTKR
jgi:hypothetical protein